MGLDTSVFSWIAGRDILKKSTGNRHILTIFDLVSSACMSHLFSTGDCLLFPFSLY